MSEPGSWLHVRVAGSDFLLSTTDLLEVVAAGFVSPLPGGPRGIQGVVIYEGEFLPVLAWEQLPGCEARASQPVALAVLRSRLGLPLDKILGTIDIPSESLVEVDEADPASSWQGGSCQVGAVCAKRVDVDRLIGLLNRLREDR